MRQGRFFDAKTLNINFDAQNNAQNFGVSVLSGDSAKNALFINRMVPGACIPDALIDRLNNAADPAMEGIAIAAEQVKRYLGIVQGVHLMAVRAEERIPRILDLAGISSLPG